jgi:predicted metal-dependent hydrolase
MQRLVQLALDLFEAQRPGKAVAEAEKANIQSNQPDVGVDPTLVAPKSIVIKPAQSAAASLSLLSASEFRHPQANRELLLGQAVVAYHLQRARRRTIGFTVGADGLAVRAPSWVTLGAVDEALREKSDWIVRKLHEARERQQRVEGGRIAWADGVQLPYLGVPLTVVLDPGHGFTGKGGALVELPAAVPLGAGAQAYAHVGASDQVDAQRSARQLYIGLSRHAGPAQIRDAVQAWLMRDARRYFTARLDHFAPQLGVRWTSLRLSNAQTRWGSAKADGSIRLNWRLLHYSPAVIDYVVVHELSHLRVMDHSPRFWSTVETVLPNYGDLRSVLRDQPAPLW